MRYLLAAAPILLIWTSALTLAFQPELSEENRRRLERIEAVHDLRLNSLESRMSRLETAAIATILANGGAITLFVGDKWRYLKQRNGNGKKGS